MTSAPKKLPPDSPINPPPYEIADVAAIQKCIAGVASPEQQKRAIDWIIRVAAATYDLSFRAGGDDGRRATDFVEGRRFVGLQIVKLSNINIERLRKSNG